MDANLKMMASARALLHPYLDDREIVTSSHCIKMFVGVSRPLTNSLHLSKNDTLVLTSRITTTIFGQHRDLVISIFPNLQESVSVR